MLNKAFTNSNEQIPALGLLHSCCCNDICNCCYDEITHQRLSLTEGKDRMSSETIKYLTALYKCLKISTEQPWMLRLQQTFNFFSLLRLFDSNKLELLLRSGGEWKVCLQALGKGHLIPFLLNELGVQRGCYISSHSSRGNACDSTK